MTKARGKNMFVHFRSFKEYEENALGDAEEIARFRSLTRAEKIAEVREVDEVIHVTTRNTDYDEELDNIW